MKTLPLIQGTPEWDAHRAHSRNASEARVPMGVIEYETGAEMMRRKKTGLAPAITPWQQRIFDAGHAVEPELRAYAERLTGEEFEPMVATTDDGYLSASFDGITLMGDMLLEAKQANSAKMTWMQENGTVPPVDVPQVAQQFAVADTATRLLYVCGDGTDDGTDHVIVARESLADEIAKLRPAWAQFDADLAAFDAGERVAPPAPAGRAPTTLPTVHLTVTGAVTDSNLTAFREQAMAVIGGIKRELTTDQDFADAAITVKWCKEAEDRLAAAKKNALAQTATIDEAFHVIDDVSAALRRARLDLNKLVQVETANRKAAIITTAQRALGEHVAALEKKVGHGVQLRGIESDFAGAIRGKSSEANIRAAVDAVLASAEVQATMLADRVVVNLGTIRTLGEGFSTLFPDAATLALQLPGVVADTITARIARAKAEQEARAKAAAERAAREAEAAERARLAREAAARTTPAPAAAPQPSHGVMRAVDAEAAPEFTLLANQPAPSKELTLSLAVVNHRLAPITISTRGAKSLGVAATQVRAASMFSEADYQALLSALARHIGDLILASAQEEVAA